MTIDARAEAQYVFSDRYPERRAVYDAIDRLSDDARTALPALIDVRYGPHPLDTMDIFPGEQGAPLIAFIHGGYWRSMDKRSFSYVAPPYRALGYSVAALNYPLAPAASLSSIVESVRRSLRWLASPAGRAVIPEIQVIVPVGHSAGGHLAACLASRAAELPLDVPGFACISGLFDLAPLMNTSLAAQVGLTSINVRQLSPVRERHHRGWLVAAVGGNETDGFVHEQTERFAEVRARHGALTEVLSLRDRNHYTVLMDLARADGEVLRSVHSRLQCHMGAHSEA